MKYIGYKTTNFLPIKFRIVDLVAVISDSGIGNAQLFVAHTVTVHCMNEYFHVSKY